MKKVVILLFLIFSFQNSNAQLFSKERVANLQDFDEQRWSWGYFLGFNNYDFKFKYKNPTEDILVEKSTGFNVGLVGDLRINKYLNLRLEPGLYFTNRNLYFPGNFETENDQMRETTSTYIHVPLLLKVSTKRLNNWKPFVEGGFSFSNNLSSNETNPDDNSAGQFRMKTTTYYYEVGFGIDFYLYYFKFTPSIRGIFALNNELVPDVDPESIYTSNVVKMMSRGIFINFTFQ
ncbi:MAG: porin family protein [Leeuwenhoekiella sp.]